MNQTFSCYRCKRTLAENEWWLCLMCAEGKASEIQVHQLRLSEPAPASRERLLDDWDAPEERRSGPMGRINELAGAVQRFVETTFG
jgi:hypothetical protein